MEQKNTGAKRIEYEEKLKIELLEKLDWWTKIQVQICMHLIRPYFP